MGLTRAVGRKVTDYDNPRSVAARLRRRRIAPLVGILAEVHARLGRVRVLDLGGTRSYWRIVPEDVLAQYDVTNTVLNLDERDDERFAFVEGDARALPDCPDDAFDVVHSNSVLEHIGEWPDMMLFAGEVRRLAPAYFVQTPYFWFPIEPHCMTPFFHWLPEPVRVGLVMRFGLGHWGRCATVDEALAAVRSARLLDRRMLGTLFPDAELLVEWVALPKSLVAIRRPPAAAA